MHVRDWVDTCRDSGVTDGSCTRDVIRITMNSVIFLPNIL